MLMNILIESHHFLKENRHVWISAMTLLGAIIGSYLGSITYRTSQKILKQNDLCEPNQVIHFQGEVNKYQNPIPYKNSVNQYFHQAWQTITHIKWFSHCSHCFSYIAPQYNIPILSWLYLKGRCVKCKHSIPLRYLLIELQTLAIFFLVASHIPYSLASGFFLLFMVFSIALFWTDLEHFLLPNVLTLSMLFVGLVVNWGDQFVSFEKATLGALIGYCSFWLINGLYKTWRGYDGLGQGDIKYLSAIGAWLGYTGLPYIVFIASVLGLTTVLVVNLMLIICPKSFQLHSTRLKHHLPFGVFLSIASSLYFYWAYFYVH